MDMSTQELMRECGGKQDQIMKEPHARFEIKMVVTVINQSIKLIRMDVIVSIHLDSIFELI